MKALGSLESRLKGVNNDSVMLTTLQSYQLVESMSQPGHHDSAVTLTPISFSKYSDLQAEAAVTMTPVSF
jgi:hypothetical protein